mmetsp:Transcript_14200/g.2296  ORF Transcript_14200/g.2296 Transcript_14200/m.2296 type:complete len:136 (-) Transcript_14200:3675-4082(-)
MHQPVVPVKERTLKFRKGNLDFIDDSFEQYGKQLTNSSNFLSRLIDFSNYDKDNINDETCELLEPYLSLEHFNPETARAASGAATGMCVWVGAMVQYHEASKIVKPKMDFLAIQEQRLTVATQALEEAEAELKES